jgi:hypothetical protein
MMSRRALLSLCAASVATLGTGLALRPRGAADAIADAGGLVFPGLAANLGRSAKLELRKQDQVLVLVRRGETWVLPASADYPVRATKVRETLTGLTELRYIEARTADPAVFAIGDVSWRPMPRFDRMFRLESVANALEQARQAASVITGRTPPPHEVTWNWSDQYDLKYQFAGLPFDADDIIVRGDPGTGRFAVFHLKGDVLEAVEAVNAPAEFMAGRQLIGQRKPISRARLADATVSMKEVAA